MNDSYQYERVSVDTDTNNWIQDGTDWAKENMGLGGAAALPGISHTLDVASSLWDGATGGSSGEAATLEILATVGDLAIQAGSLASDPLGTLISWGLDVLLGLIRPLEDLLHQVSGDPGQMRDTATVWGRAAEAVAGLSQGTVNSLNPLADYDSTDGEACRKKIDNLAASLYRVASTCSGVQSILSGAQALAEIIKECIKWLISQLIKFFIQVVAPGIAAGIATFGASAAAAIGLAVKETASTTIKATTYTKRIIAAFLQLKDAIISFAKEALPGIVVASLKNIPSGLDGFSNNLPDRPQLGARGGLVQLDPDALRKAAPILEEVADDAGKVAEVVADSKPEEMTWGICGLFGFVDSYNVKVEEINDLLQSGANTLKKVSRDITKSAESWEKCDEALAKAFADIEIDLPSK